MQHAIYGNFSAPKVQEIVVSRGKVLELLRPDDQGRVQTVCSTEVFGLIRSLKPFRFPGSHEDYVIAGSDSGRIVILKFSKEKNMFVKAHQETFGKSGCRRIVPGEYLAVDPKGRACLIGALEKQKFVYVLNRDSEARLTISSPLEAHKSYHVVFDIVGLDTGFDNPQFAAIELDYGEADVDPTGEAAEEASKQLVLYELDLGLNSVVRKSSETIDNGANMLISVPGVADGGPGGVIVGCENFLLYRNFQGTELRAVIPRREGIPLERSVLITASAMLKQKSKFFTIAQSEFGDLYKVSLVYEGNSVSELKVKYFDSIPPASSLCILRRGFLFAASEFGSHSLYQFEGLGDDDAVESSSEQLKSLQNGHGNDADGYPPVFFNPRYPLVNLDPIDTVESICPVIDMKIGNLLGEETPQIFAACGKGPRSSLQLLRPGLSVTEMAVSEVPGAPVSVFTLRKTTEDQYDSFIVISFVNATLVLRVGETVEQTDDTGFLTDAQTVGAQHMFDNSFVQVLPNSIRHIQQSGRVVEWQAPGRRNITKVATNERQVAIALSGGELIYFELTSQGNLVETERKELGGDVSSLSLGDIPEGSLRSKFLAVGSYDKTVRILSLDPGDNMASLSTQVMVDTPESLLLHDSSLQGEQDGNTIHLQIGLANGMLSRTEVDRVTGQLSDTRTRLLGTKSVRLFSINVSGRKSMLALSSRPWLGYIDQGRYVLAPISYEQLDYAAGRFCLVGLFYVFSTFSFENGRMNMLLLYYNAAFASEQCTEGFVAVTKNSLRVIALDRLGQFFNQRGLQLRYTPRKLVIHPDYSTIITVESDAQCKSLAVSDGDGDTSMFGTDDPTKLAQLGSYYGEKDEWASCVRIVDPATMQSLHCIELDNNEAAISAAIVPFESTPDKGPLLCVGTTKSLKFYPRKTEGNFIRIYEFLEDGKSLSFLHSTEVDAIPRAMVAFKGKLLAGIGPCVKLFDLGKKRLLRKCEYKMLPADVVSLHAFGSRVYVGDSYESVHFMKYKRAENKFYIFADDSIPRHIVSVCPLDYDTVAASDKFGNITVLRLPPEMSAAVEEDPTAGKYAGEGSAGAPNRLQSVANFFVGETVSSLQRAVMQPHGKESIIYSTINGAIGALHPLSSRDTVDFFQHLEMHMRQEAPPLLGRDHLAFRSSYVPVKDIIDGDLCSQFGRLSYAVQRSIAEELDRSPTEVVKKIEDVANLII